MQGGNNRAKRERAADIPSNESTPGATITQVLAAEPVQPH
jgi:hypothetical protein